MSNNCIEHLPKRLGDLRLVQLDLSANKLANTTLSDWDWLDGSSIKSTLQALNLSDNSVTYSLQSMQFEAKSLNWIALISRFS